MPYTRRKLAYGLVVAALALAAYAQPTAVRADMSDDGSDPESDPTAPPAPAVPLPPPGATMGVQFVVSAGESPDDVVAQLAGQSAYFERAPGSGMVPSPQLAERLQRTYILPVAPGSEQAVLAQALAVQGVESATLVRWPAIVPM
jgi:hypothetical protein